MDYNLAFSCVGYGSIRVMRERAYFVAPHALPSAWIMAKPDPVQFCIEAMQEAHPEWVGDIDEDTRRTIFRRLSSEAQRSGLH